MKVKDLKIMEIEWDDIVRGKYDVELGTGFARLWKGKIDIKQYLQSYGKYCKLDNGRYNMVDHSHVAMLHNIAIDLESAYTEKDMPEESLIKVPKIEGLSEAKVVFADGNCVGFSDGDGVTMVSMEYLVDFIKTFGVPDSIVCGEDMPISMQFGGMEVMLAPRIASGDGVDDGKPDGYSFDFQEWCPQLFGMMFDGPNVNQLLKLIYSMPKQSMISDLLERIENIKKQTGKSADMADYL